MLIYALLVTFLLGSLVGAVVIIALSLNASNKAVAARELEREKLAQESRIATPITVHN